MKIKEKVLKDLKENWICANNTDLVKTGIDLTLAEVMKMIDEIDFSNIIRKNSNLGASKTQDRIKKYFKQKLTGDLG